VSSVSEDSTSDQMIYDGTNDLPSTVCILNVRHCQLRTIRKQELICVLILFLHHGHYVFFLAPSGLSILYRPGETWPRQSLEAH
jgi:hypothetical protein